ncbi:uncharacterized protein LOC143225729 isoform X2 [Tachypleus tridentatus]|uniref:uncharacterized protein LOC143225729 isoform X2 n=1 Tax=Tachypleus tridentatus TaxID=6853 RepID=UPI003FD2DC54
MKFRYSLTSDVIYIPCYVHLVLYALVFCTTIGNKVDTERNPNEVDTDTFFHFQNASETNKGTNLWQKQVIIPKNPVVYRLKRLSAEVVMDNFQINRDTIIRTQDSRALGAKYLNETELPTNEDCIYWCWKVPKCNVAVYEEKTRGSCYLFDCGTNDDFLCKFTSHGYYTSSILRISQHPYDLSQWGAQVKHEHDLTKFQKPTKSPPVSSQSFVLPVNHPVTKQESEVESSSVGFSTVSPSGKQSLEGIKNRQKETNTESHCRHYQFQCHNSSECIAIYNVCDGIPQCLDGSDEGKDLQCPYPVSIITEPAHPVSNPSENFIQNGQHLSPLIAVHQVNGQQQAVRPDHVPLQHSEVSQVVKVSSERQPSGNWGQQNGASGNFQKESLPYHAENQLFQSSHPSAFSHKHSNFLAANSNYNHLNYPKQWSVYYNKPYDQQIEQLPQQELDYSRYQNGYYDHHYNGGGQNNQGIDQGQYWPGDSNGHNMELGYQLPVREGLPQQQREPVSQDQGMLMYPQRQWLDSSNPQKTPYMPGAKSYPQNNDQHVAKVMDQSSQPQVPASGYIDEHPYIVPQTEYERPSLSQSQVEQQQPYLRPQAQQPLMNYQRQPSVLAGRDRNLNLKQNHQDLQSLNVENDQAYQPVVAVPHEKINHHQKLQKVVTTMSAVLEDSLSGSSPIPKKKMGHEMSQGKSSHEERDPVISEYKMTLSALEESSRTHAHQSNSAVLALTLGLCITALLLVLVGCRMRTIRRRFGKRGRSSLAHDADYLVNGMYL